RYGALFERELSLQDSVRACIKSGDERLQQYQQALDETRADLEQTRKKLAALETEKGKLIDRLGPKNIDAPAPEQFEKLNRTLEKLLDRLGNLDKRVEKLERQK